MDKGVQKNAHSQMSSGQNNFYATAADPGLLQTVKELSGE